MWLAKGAGRTMESWRDERRDLRRTPRRIAIVGNAPETGDHAAAIDAADWVVRFNNAAGFGEATGSRVTHLALVNHGGQMREWLEDPGFLDRRPCGPPGASCSPSPASLPSTVPQGEDGRDWTAEAEARLGTLGVPVAVLPSTVHREAVSLVTCPAARRRRRAPGSRLAPPPAPATPARWRSTSTASASPAGTATTGCASGAGSRPWRPAACFGSIRSPRPWPRERASGPLLPVRGAHARADDPRAPMARRLPATASRLPAAPAGC